MKYRRHDNFQKYNNPTNWENGCDFCKEPFADDEKFTRIDVQNGYMRGDDDVFVFHNRCMEGKTVEQIVDLSVAKEDI